MGPLGLMLPDVLFGSNSYLTTTTNVPVDVDNRCIFLIPDEQKGW